MRDLLAELRRRRVFRVAAVYAGVAFIVWQAADIAFPALQLPAWMVTAVVALTILGFPIALVLAWAFDITPEGVRRTEPAAPGDPVNEAPPITATPAPRGGWTAQRLAAVGGVLVLAATGLAFALTRSDGGLDRNRVLVVAFDNETGDPALDPLGRMAADWIARGLTETGMMEVVTPTSALLVARDAREGGVPALAAGAGARTVVTGVYYREGDDLQFQVQVTDAGRGRLLGTLEPVSVPVDSPTVAMATLRARVAGFLALRFDRRLDTGAVRLAVAPSFAAYREFMDGLELIMLRQDHTAGLSAFARSAELDPDFMAPRIWMIVAQFNLANRAATDSLVRMTEPLQERLEPFDRAMFDVVRALHESDHATALHAARRLAQMAPGSEWQYQLGVSALRAGHPTEAVRALRSTDPARGLLREWPAYWLVLGEARHVLGQHRQELREVRRGRQLLPDHVAMIRAEGRALVALGRPAEAEALVQRLVLMQPSPGQSPVAAIREIASELRAHGHPEAAGRAYLQAIAWYSARPAAERDRQRAALAGTLYEAGRWDEARALYEELAAAGASGPAGIGRLGVIAARGGDVARAREAERRLEGWDEPFTFGAPTLFRARIAAQLGEVDRAVLLLRQAFAEGVAYGSWLHADPDLDPLRAHAGFRELVRPRG
jgi:tetratricopeptide (TPR) repeat protein/TolB-like protein